MMMMRLQFTELRTAVCTAELSTLRNSSRQDAGFDVAPFNDCEEFTVVGMHRPGKERGL